MHGNWECNSMDDLGLGLSSEMSLRLVILSSSFTAALPSICLLLILSLLSPFGLMNERRYTKSFRIVVLL